MEGQEWRDSQTTLQTVPRVDSSLKWVEFSPTKQSDPALPAKVDRDLGLGPVEKLTDQTSSSGGVLKAFWNDF